MNGVWRLFRAPRVSCMGSAGSAAQAKSHRGTGCGALRGSRGSVPVLSPSEAPRDSRVAEQPISRLVGLGPGRGPPGAGTSPADP